MLLTKKKVLSVFYDDVLEHSLLRQRTLEIEGVLF